jgi:hypothetical protein
MSKPIGTLVRLRRDIAVSEIDPDLLVIVQGERSWGQAGPIMCTCKCLATGALSIWCPWQLEEAKENEDG